MARLTLISEGQRNHGQGGAFAVRALLSNRLVLMGGVVVLFGAASQPGSNDPEAFGAYYLWHVSSRTDAEVRR